jgi:hypothetical protein
MNWKQAAADVRWNVQPFLQGRYRSSTSTDTYETVNPATETPLCQIPSEMEPTSTKRLRLHARDSTTVAGRSSLRRGVLMPVAGNR